MTLEGLKSEIDLLQASNEACKRRLAKLQAILDVKMEETPQSPKLERWKPEYNTQYYFIDDDAEILDTSFVSVNDVDRWKFFNCFPTKEEAEKEAKRTTARRKLEWLARELNKGKQEGSCLFFLCVDNSLLARSVPSIGEIYFYEKADAEYALSQMKPEELEALR